MKFSHLTLAGAVLAGVLAQVAPATAQSSSDYAAGEILVKTAATGKVAMARYQVQTGAKLVTSFPTLGWSRIKLPAGSDVVAAIAKYKKIPGVVSAEPNYIVHEFKTPNDALYKQLYGLQKISAPAAWNTQTGSDTIVVGVADTGIRYDHVDLAANMWHNPKEIPNNGIDDDGNGIVDDYYGYDAVNKDGDPMDDEGHGTHCSGIIGAVGNNGVGPVGVNWKVKLMALKHLSASGSGLSSDAVSVYEYAIAQKKSGVNLRVISNSWGGHTESTAVTDVMKEAADNGIISICAAGNDGTDNDLRPTYPAGGNVPGLVSVAASDQNDQPASFSSYGKTSVDLAAPGVDILSTFNKSTTAYTYESGTSMACPAVAGAAALLLSQVPGLDVAAIRNRLIQSVDVLPIWNEKVVSHGRLNLAKLLATGSYRIGGRILDASGKALAGAQIYVNDSTTAATQSRRDGSYSVDGLTPGSYLLTVKLAGFQFNPTPARITVKAGAGFSVRQDFSGSTSAETYTISGTVYSLVGTTKVPIEGAQIFIGSKVDPVAVTNAKGVYSIADRVAGTYYLTAQYSDLIIKSVDRNNAVAVVTLPRKPGQNLTTDFVAVKADNTAPVVVITTPGNGATYDEGALTTATGTATDTSGISLMEFLLYRSEPGGISYYDWDLKEWIDPDTTISSSIFLLKSFGDETAVSWTIDDQTFPKLTVGNYNLTAYAFDGASNIGQKSNSFVVQSVGTIPGYPKITFTSPTVGQQVAPNTSITAKGTVTDDQGVSKLYIYLRRFDANGKLIGYYNWVTKTFVTGTTDFNIYKTFDANQVKSYNFSLLLPKLVPGNYEIGAFGRDIIGNEPPVDGSADTLRPFVVADGTTPLVKAPGSAGSS